MDLVRNFVGQELFWAPVKMLKAQYELYAGDRLLATLDISNWSSKADAVAAEGALEIRE